MTSIQSIYFCVTLSGHGFDPYAYADSKYAPLGKVYTRKHSGPPLLDDHPPTYWSSQDQVSSRETLTIDIENFLKSVKQSDPEKWHGLVSVQVVDNSRTSDKRGGYYFSTSLIRLLSEMNADIDIDVAYGDLV